MPLPMLFDLDGTLVHSLPDIAASANFVRRRYGLPEVAPDTVRGWIGDGIDELLRRTLGTLDGRVDLAEAVEAYRGHHREQCTKLVAPFPGVRRLVAAWHERGHPLAVVTNKAEFFARRILAHVGIERYFAVVIGGDTTAQRKPDPEPVLTALDRLGVPRDRGLMVGDSRNDLHAGRRAGIRTAAVTYGYGPVAELLELRADEYWESFGAGHQPA